MKLACLIAAALVIVPAAPALSESLLDTHEEVRMAPSKFPARLYRPINRDTCAAGARHHQAGKMMLHAAPAGDCAETASRNARGAAKLASN